MSPEEKALIELARLRGVSPERLRMRLAVGDDVIRDIVRDNRSRSHSTSLMKPQREAERPKVEAKEVPLGPPPGIAIADRLMDQADRLDRRELAKRLKG